MKPQLRPMVQRSWRPMLTALLALACAGAAKAQPAPIPGVLILPADCPLTYPAGGYVPAIQLPIGVADDMRRDPNRGHDVPYRVYFPVNGLSPAPIVFWNHGGGATSVVQTVGTTKITSGQRSSECRAYHLARAGFVVYVIGRLPAEGLNADMLRDCRAAGWNGPAYCRERTGHFVYGPQNIRYLHAALQVRPTVLPQMPAQDFSRVLVGGWSGGTTSVLNIAGAPQRIGDLRIAPVSIPAVTAFMASAPRGPVWGGFESVGFQEQAFFNLGTRPFLSITGRSDVGPGDGGEEVEQPVSRTMAWLSAQRGNKYISWTTVSEADGGPVHGTMDLSNCSSPGKYRFCQWYLSLSAAFADATLRNSVAARNWLASDAYLQLTGGDAELHRR